jgi:diadenylate cyclase
VFERFLALFADRSAIALLRDAADITIVAVIVYRVLLVLRGTRALQMVVGLAMIGLLNQVARAAGLVTVVNLLGAVLSSIVLIVVVVFQNDIRRALTRFGDRVWMPGFAREQESRVVEEVVAAATELARHRVGAIIAFEQDANLDEFVLNHGIAMEANVTRELLVTTFVPESINKLHDGALIIRNLRVASAGVFFPMPESHKLDPSLGSRHRAALGITEETDAAVVVVSEERGSISVCYRSEMFPSLDGAALRATLFRVLGHQPVKRSAAREGDGPGSTRDSRLSGADPRAVAHAPTNDASRPATIPPPRFPGEVP